jgi:predicted nucleotidyltransferase
MKLTNRNIDLLVKYFEDKPVFKAYLFGSLARNESNIESDIDILVELDYSKPIGLEFFQMQLDLEELLNKKVDLVSEKAISKYIRPYVDHDKVLIYERRSGR